MENLGRVPESHEGDKKTYLNPEQRKKNDALELKYQDIHAAILEGEQKFVNLILEIREKIKSGKIIEHDYKYVLDYFNTYKKIRQDIYNEKNMFLALLNKLEDLEKKQRELLSLTNKKFGRLLFSPEHLPEQAVLKTKISDINSELDKYSKERQEAFTNYENVLKRAQLIVSGIDPMLQFSELQWEWQDFRNNLWKHREEVSEEMKLIREDVTQSFREIYKNDISLRDLIKQLKENNINNGYTQETVINRSHLIDRNKQHIAQLSERLPILERAFKIETASTLEDLQKIAKSLVKDANTFKERNSDRIADDCKVYFLSSMKEVQKLVDMDPNQSGSVDKFPFMKKILRDFLDLLQGLKAEERKLLRPLRKGRFFVEHMGAN